jgi:hypothetical protein
MELLKEMRGVVGELVYAAEVKNLLASFPLFETFEKSVAKVDVIHLVDDDADNNHKKPRYRHRSVETPRSSSDSNLESDTTSCTEPDLSNTEVANINVPKINWEAVRGYDDDDEVPPVVAVSHAGDMEANF